MKSQKLTEEQERYYDTDHHAILYNKDCYKLYQMSVMLRHHIVEIKIRNEPKKYPCLIKTQWDDQCGNAQGFFFNTIWYKEGHECKTCGHKHTNWPESILPLIKAIENQVELTEKEFEAL